MANQYPITSLTTIFIIVINNLKYEFQKKILPAICLNQFKAIKYQHWHSIHKL